MRQNVVGQNQCVAVECVAKVEANTRPLHLATRKVEVAFAVLHRIFQLWVKATVYWALVYPGSSAFSGDKV